MQCDRLMFFKALYSDVRGIRAAIMFTETLPQNSPSLVILGGEILIMIILINLEVINYLKPLAATLKFMIFVLDESHHHDHHRIYFP